MQIPVLMTGIVFGKAIATWVRFSRKFRHLTKSPHPQPLSHPMGEGGVGLSPIEAEREKSRRIVGIIFILLLLFAGSALWQPERVTGFQYHGIPRWSGVWDDPNLYGLLMGVGAVLAVGLLTSNIQHLSPRGIAASIPQGNSNIQWRKILWVVLCLFAAILSGYGLFKSYSRGAWLAVFAGLMYLIAKAESGKRKAEISCSSRFKKNWLPLSVVLASVFVLTFWQFRFSELRPAQ